MDETAVWFDMVGESTVAAKGTKSVPLKSTGHEKLRFTVILTANGAGAKLKPYVVFFQVESERSKSCMRKSR